MKLPAASCGVFGKREYKLQGSSALHQKMRENRNFRVAQDVLSERLRAIVCAVKESVENRESRWARSFVGGPV
jgi:hypothetical protein